MEGYSTDAKITASRPTQWASLKELINGIIFHWIFLCNINIIWIFCSVATGVAYQYLLLIWKYGSKPDTIGDSTGVTEILAGTIIVVNKPGTIGPITACLNQVLLVIQHGVIVRIPAHSCWK